MAKRTLRHRMRVKRNRDLLAKVANILREVEWLPARGYYGLLERPDLLFLSRAGRLPGIKAQR